MAKIDGITAFTQLTEARLYCFFVLFVLFLIYVIIFLQEEEYKRLSEALAEDGMYNTVGFQYKSDYYDPSQPTEEEEPQKDKDDRGISLSVNTLTLPTECLKQTRLVYQRGLVASPDLF